MWDLFEGIISKLGLKVQTTVEQRPFRHKIMGIGSEPEA